MELSFGDIEVLPGSTENFYVESKCGSTVSLSFIDQRVLLLKDGNEILYNDVLNAVRPFDFEFLPFPGRFIVDPNERNFLVSNKQSMIKILKLIFSYFRMQK